MTTKTLLRAMALIAAAGGAMAVVMPFLSRAETQPPARRRRATRRPATPATAPGKPGTEKAARGTHKGRSGNGGSPSHH